MGFVRAYDRVKGNVNRILLDDGLRARAARGGAWLGSGSAAEQASRFARNILLTRLLAPSAFGSMAIVLSSSSLIASLSDVGVWPAVIQSPRGGDDGYLNAAWWFGMARAAFIYVIVFALAPWISIFYGNAELTPLLRVTLLSIILDGMLSPRAKLAYKEMKFGQWAIINNGGGICGVILTIVLSFVLRDVWALAIGYCGENAFRCIFSYILFPGLPSVEWDRSALLDIAKYSKGMIGLSFLNLVFARTDIFVLGKLYSPATLGLYTMAVNLIQTPSGFVISMLATTLLPAFSHVQGDKERLSRILSEITSWVVLLGVPAVAMICLCGGSLLRVTYGAGYAAGAGALAFATGVALLNTLNSLVTTLFFATGHPALHRRAVAASAIIMLIAVYPSCKYLGVVGGQVAALVAIAASYLLQVVRARKITGLPFLQYGKVLLPATLMAAGIIIVGLGARILGLAARPGSDIAIAFAVCIVAYVMCVPIFARIREAA
jgi:O-antigen/teichoic acid export membrane protein